MSSTIDCPKCEHEHFAIGIHEEDEGHYECSECGFNFVVSVEYDPDYSTECAVCDFEETVKTFAQYPNAPFRTCRICGKIKFEEPAAES